MVFAFIISTLTGERPFVLFYQVYTEIAPTISSEPSDSQSETVGHLSRTRGCKSHIAGIAETVHSEYQFRRETKSITAEEDLARLTNDDTLPDFEMGHFTVPLSSLSSTFAASDSMFVTWMGAAFTGFTLVCEACENRLLAEHILRLIVRFLQEHVRVLNQPMEVASRVERVNEVLKRILRNGNLLFLNHRAVRQIEKELDSSMKTLS
ncbi:hypothetical protein C0Q70_10360 [Pomacea canaliculata]|uniref:AP complex mu/sigma subunit domain-containing protein n=1 Tax=Pomacea canaliculata TaxID=400727 RepID=A0A2T7PCD4_POMCA|nr:uncharacterized protein LOC112564514 [Pomacea canaliculata]PVD31083.1 hypothetical protein C0Q70_10360 [Pomacea canaliculata]